MRVGRVTAGQAREFAEAKSTAFYGAASVTGYQTGPGYRGRGAQLALIAARVEAARSAGCDWVIAEAAAGDNPSVRNQQRAGLGTCYERQHWTWRDSKGA